MIAAIKAHALTLALLLLCAVLGRGYLIQRDAAIQAQAQTRAALGNAELAVNLAGACSKAVDKLSELAAQRAREAQTARTAAAAAAHSHNQRADTILAAPAAVPGNDCRSAQVRVHNWLQGRAQP